MQETVTISLKKYETMQKRINELETETDSLIFMFGNKSLKKEIKLLNLKLWEERNAHKKTTVKKI